MDPTAYCEQAIEQLRDKRSGAFSDRQQYEVLIVLSSFGRQDLSPPHFTQALKLLIERCERAGQPKTAAAARQILSDWLSRPPTERAPA